MNLLIPVRANREAYTLKYAIRSICQHNDIERCLLIGFKPKWYTGEHIQHPDYSSDYKEQNIRDKVVAGAQIMDEFLFANDDHFMMAPYMGVHNKGTLSETLRNRQPNGSYTHLMRSTFEMFGDVPNVDTHYPMEMNKAGVEKTVFEWPRWGIGFKTTYAYLNNIHSVYHPDNKVNDIKHAGPPYFSTSSICQGLEKLNEMFKEKSIFEI
jgi:hypothetical protein